MNGANVTDSLIYNGQELTALGQYGSSFVVRQDIDVRPQKRVTKVIIPGRNGSQYIDDDVYENVIISYTFGFTDFSNCDELVNYLLAQNGFNRLEDQYDTDTYRMARVNGILRPTTKDREMGSLVVSFECQPERYLKPTTDYPETITISDNSVHEIQNPTRFDAKPLIRVYGDEAEVKIRRKLDGVALYMYSFTVGDISSLSPVPNSFVIDSDKEDCYANVINMNSFVTFNGDSHGFPLLVGIKSSTTGSGVTQVQIGSGSISKIKITPRWWKL